MSYRSAPLLLALTLIAAAAVPAWGFDPSPEFCDTCTFDDLNETAAVADVTYELHLTGNVTAEFVPVDGTPSNRTLCFGGAGADDAIARFRNLSKVYLLVMLNATNCSVYVPLPGANTTTLPATVTTTLTPTTNASVTTTVVHSTTAGPSTMAPTTATVAPETTTPVTPAPETRPPPTPAPLQFTATFVNAAAASQFASRLAAVFNIPVDSIIVVRADNNTVVFRFTGNDASALSQQFNALGSAELLAAFGITKVETTTVTPPPDTRPPSPLQFTATFVDATAASQFASRLAVEFHIPVDSITIVRSDNNTVVFRFNGNDASALSQQFNALDSAELLVAFGITKVESQPAPVDNPSSGDDSTRLALLIALPIAGVIIIVIIIAFIKVQVSKRSPERVDFQQYVAMTSKSPRDAASPRAGDALL
jgi:hypothetical protein